MGVLGRVHRRIPTTPGFLRISAAVHGQTVAHLMLRGRGVRPCESDLVADSVEVAMVRKLLVIGLLGVCTLLPTSASALTVEQLVALSKSGVTDTVILALIDRDRTVFDIGPERIVSLQLDGLSEKVILAMLKSGRDEGEQAARADSAYNSAWIASTLSTEPAMVTVGHGPVWPNTP